MTTFSKFVFFINMALVPLTTFFAGYAANDTNVNQYKVGFFILVAVVNRMSAVGYVRENYIQTEVYHEY
jgi:uncharacterized membrane protein